MKGIELMKTITKNIFVALAITIFAGVIVFTTTGCGKTEEIAATVNGHEIKEETISAYISNIRKTNKVEDDKLWAQWLVDNNKTPEDIRNEAIEHYIDQALVEEAAKKWNITVDNSEVETQFEETKKASEEANSDFNTQLAEMGYTTDTFKEYIRYSLLRIAVTDKIMAENQVTDESILETANSYGEILNGAKLIKTIILDDENKAKETHKLIVDTGDFDAFAAQTLGTELDGWDILLKTPVDQSIRLAIKPLAQGYVSDVIKSDDGLRFYIIKIEEELKCEGNPPFKSIEDIPQALSEDIRTTAEQVNTSATLDDFIEKEKEKADIKKNPMPKNAVYNVSLEGVEPTMSKKEVEDTSSFGDITANNELNNANNQQDPSQPIIPESNNPVPPNDPQNTPTPVQPTPPTQPAQPAQEPSKLPAGEVK